MFQDVYKTCIERRCFELPGWLFFIIYPAFILLAGGIFSLASTAKDDADVWYYGDFNYREGIYFAIITTTTVGYGDYFPTSDGSKIFNLFVIFFQTVLLCWGIGKLFEYWHPPNVELLTQRVKNSYCKIALLVFCPIWVFVTAGILYGTDPFFDEEERAYSNRDFLSAIHFVFVTFATIGYGDVLMESDLGRALSCMTGIFGLTTIGFSIVVIISDRILRWKQNDKGFIQTLA